MQNKGLIRLFAILFGLISLYQLSFTYFAGTVESDAKIYARENAKENNGKEIARFERKYMDSVATKEVVNLGVASYTYNDLKEKEMNLGLDLKGGFNAILQVSVKEILISLANESKEVAFRQALKAADDAQRSSNDNYLNLFFAAFEKTSKENGNIRLSAPSIFGTKALSDKIDFNKTNEEVKPVLQEEINSSIATAFEVLRSRIDKFGVTQPTIQRIGNSGRIQIELPGAKDIERVRKLLTSKAQLQFWEVYTGAELQGFFYQVNAKVTEMLKGEEPLVEQKKDTTETDSLDDLLESDTDSIAAATQKNLFTFLQPTEANSSVVASAKITDTARVNNLLRDPQVRSFLPVALRYTKFLWDYKSFTTTLQDESREERINLYAIKSNRRDIAPIEGDVIADASQVYDQLNNPEVNMTMKSNGAKLWAKMTTENVGKFVAVVLDDYVYTAPSVNTPITGGNTSISGGSMTVEEAQDIATVLKAGKLPAAARMIQSEVVGPSLGQEAIDASFRSFGLAILLVLLWMMVYYGRAGGFANVALVVNILFIFGVLASFGAVLTLPGIAGIILTIGMSVDANVIIFERIKEGLQKKKGLKQAVQEGFSLQGALSAIIDANITTFLTGIILYVFGTGPIKGFALTLMIGIATSLFTAIFITRLLIDGAVNKKANLTFNTGLSKNWFQNINIAFLRKRKIAYVISGSIIISGLISIFSIGLKQGVDFKGGRSYVVRFDQPMNATEVAGTLKSVFETAPEVKTYGSDSQLKITTVYKIDDESKDVDDEVQLALFNGLKKYLTEGTTYEDFKPGFQKSGNAIMSYIKVEPTIADDIKTSAIYAVLGSLLVVFLYILLRFRKISFSLGAVIAVFHDVLIVLGIFSILYKFMPFDMEIGQSFIAAILTVVGYSLNDTVVIFDRIREFAGIHVKRNYNEVVDKALSSTLGRTINTSLTTLLVMLAIFLFGGDSIKGFMFALIVGVLVGTYSSLFVATPVMYDTSKKEKKRQ
ncbi:MAG: protein translocase subunit SecDF [Flavobacteriaceae bacterium]|nr:MAG: protein translocase subunit SecDF [Flavobacteriaceae bacterium]